MPQVLIELARYGEKPVGELEAQRLANRLGIEAYIESSALTQRNLKEVFDQAILSALQSTEELRRLTAGRSKGNRILNSLQNWRISQASDRGGLLRSSRRSKSAKDGNDGSITTASNSASASTSASNSNSTSTSSSSSIIQQHQQPQQLYQGHKPSTSKINETNLKRQPSIWKRFCCMS